MNKANPYLSLSVASGTLTYGANENVTITKDGDGTLSCTSSNSSVATCSISGKILTITPKANTSDNLKATITVSLAEAKNYVASNVTYESTVNRRTLTCPTSPAAKTYNAEKQLNDVSCPGGSTQGGVGEGTNAGTYNRTCGANAGYKFTSACSIVLTINKYNLSNATIGNIGSQNYTGSQIKPTPSVTVPLPSGSTTTLTNNTHFTYSYSNNINAGTATLVITAKDNTNYTGTKSKTFTIAEGTATFECNDKTYTGQLQTACSCTNGTMSGDYAKINAGTYTAKCEPNANYKLETKSIQWTMNKRAVTATAPSLNSNTLTYTAASQNISKSGGAGSCSTGGQMKYYTESYTSSTAPSLTETGWTTEFPTTINKKTARTYYLWYQCYVSDTANNYWNSDVAKKVSKRIYESETTTTITANQEINIGTEPAATAKLSSNNSTISSPTFNYKYYSTQTNCANNNGSTITAPTTAGTYYVTAQVVETGNYYESTSSCTAVKYKLPYSNGDIACPSDGNKSGNTYTYPSYPNYNCVETIENNKVTKVAITKTFGDYSIKSTTTKNDTNLYKNTFKVTVPNTISNEQEIFVFLMGSYKYASAGCGCDTVDSWYKRVSYAENEIYSAIRAAKQILEFFPNAKFLFGEYSVGSNFTKLLGKNDIIKVNNELDNFFSKFSFENWCDLCGNYDISEVREFGQIIDNFLEAPEASEFVYITDALDALKSKLDKSTTIQANTSGTKNVSKINLILAGNVIEGVNPSDAYDGYDLDTFRFEACNAHDKVKSIITENSNSIYYSNMKVYSIYHGKKGSESDSHKLIAGGYEGEYQCYSGWSGPKYETFSKQPYFGGYYSQEASLFDSSPDFTTAIEDIIKSRPSEDITFTYTKPTGISVTGSSSSGKFNSNGNKFSYTFNANSNTSVSFSYAVTVDPSKFTSTGWHNMMGLNNKSKFTSSKLSSDYEFDISPMVYYSN